MKEFVLGWKLGVCVPLSAADLEDSFLLVTLLRDVLYCNAGNASAYPNNSRRNIKEKDMLVVSSADSHRFADRELYISFCYHSFSTLARHYTGDSVDLASKCILRRKRFIVKIDDCKLGYIWFENLTWCVTFKPINIEETVSGPQVMLSGYIERG